MFAGYGAFDSLLSVRSFIGGVFYFRVWKDNSERISV